jgi:hypothetical protein
MRTLSLIVLLAACSSSSSPPMEEPVTETIAMTCNTDVTAYCNANPCVKSFAAAEKDTSLCPASLINCGGFQVILKADSTKITTFYYQSDNLVAIANPSLTTGAACVAGPASFSAPKCATGGRTLSACMGDNDPPEGW